MQSRKQIVSVIEAIDEQIGRLQQSKRDTYEAHRGELTANDGKEVAKAEIEGLKKAVQRRRQIAKSGIAAIEQRDALVDEILAEVAGDENAITGQRAARHPRVAHSVPNQSTAARKDVHDKRLGVVSEGVSDATRSFSGALQAGEAAGTQAPPVDTSSEPDAPQVRDMLASATRLPDAGSDTNQEPSGPVHPDPLRSDAATRKDAETAAPDPLRLAHDEPPPHPGSFKNTNGAWRREGCQKPDACAGTWRERCGSCERAFLTHQNQISEAVE